MVRRARHPSRLRQEYARCGHGHGPAQPAGHHGLRRDHQARLCHHRRRRTETRCGFGLPELRPEAGRNHHRGATSGDRGQCHPRLWRLRRHVHRQHHGHRHRGDGSQSPLLVVHAGRRPGQSGRVCGCRQGHAHAVGERPHPPQDRDPGVDGKRHGHQRRPGRIDQRRAAPHRHRPGL